MLCLALSAQLAVATYSSPAVRGLVSRAATENRTPPPSFHGYESHVESELSLILRDTAGRENAAQIEQFASRTTWEPGGKYEMHIVGYRSQGIGVPYSTLTFVKGWTVPSLYGERLRLGVVAPGDTTGPRARDDVIAVHPFAADRDRYYRFSGGDTVGVVNTGRRTITIVRVHVSPALPDSARVAAFDGDIQLDLERGQIVRMRGQFVVSRGGDRRPVLARMPGVIGVAYCDFVNAEVDGRYWLPASQRSEFQASIALLGRTRAVMRVVSEFSDYQLADSAGAPAMSSRVAHVTTWAPSDSVAHFGEWHESLGTITSSVGAGDFDDIGPDVWRTTGPPRFDLFPTRTEHVVGFDRVEGVYTGIEGSVHFRDAAPGLSMGADAGWGWSEETLRGGANVALQRGSTTLSASGERRLVTTNDFIRPLDPEAGGLGALFGSVDDFDYVDRRRAMLTAVRTSGVMEGYVMARVGAGRDVSESARVTRGIFGGTAFRPNRLAETGSYRLASVIGEWHPSVSGDFVQPGLGGKLLLEDAGGELAWRRAEVAVNAREYVGPVTFALHGDAGVVAGNHIPPQQLYELGGTGSLFGYDYKQFVGDRAALFRGYASYTFPVFRAPHHAWRNFFIPGLAPGLAAGVSGGWTEISSAAARQSVVELGALPHPDETHGVRATIGGGITLFGGNVHAGLARAVDQHSPWKLAIGLGQEF